MISIDLFESRGLRRSVQPVSCLIRIPIQSGKISESSVLSTSAHSVSTTPGKYTRLEKEPVCNPVLNREERIMSHKLRLLAKLTNRKLFSGPPEPMSEQAIGAQSRDSSFDKQTSEEDNISLETDTGNDSMPLVASGEDIMPQGIEDDRQSVLDLASVSHAVYKSVDSGLVLETQNYITPSDMIGVDSPAGECCVHVPQAETGLKDTQLLHATEIVPAVSQIEPSSELTLRSEFSDDVFDLNRSIEEQVLPVEKEPSISCVRPTIPAEDLSPKADSVINEFAICREKLSFESDPTGSVHESEKTDLKSGNGTYVSEDDLEDVSKQSPTAAVDKPHQDAPTDGQSSQDEASSKSSTARRKWTAGSDVIRLHDRLVKSFRRRTGSFRKRSSTDYGNRSGMESQYSSSTEDLSGYGIQSQWEEFAVIDKALESVETGVTVTEEASTLRQRQNALRAHPFFVMEVVLREGRDLVVRDACGTSDPYVKFKIGGKQYYKSRTVFKNLNPKWEEKLVLPIEDPFLPITLQVYDYDRGLNDDFMGKAEIDPSTFELNSPTEIKLMLSEDKKKKKDAYMGYLILQCTLLPKTQDEKEQYFKRISKAGEAKKNKTQLWSSVVTICLVEGKKLIPMDDNGLSDPYVKFRLGNERYKSKYKAKTLNPTWLEQFDLHMFDDQTSHLEISVWDHDIGGKDDIMGRGSIDLCQYDQEVTHRINLELDDGAGTIHFMLSITGTAGNENVSDLATYNLTARDRQDVVRKYGVVRSFNNLKDIGWLQVKVIKAQGLAAADLGGKSDPFCVLELVNDRLQTHTEYKTLFPEWGKVFTLNVKDIHSILEVTVYDEDRDKKSEFLGKVAIPLLRIKRGECRWYGLKDKKLGLRAKGAILLELDFIYNHFKAAIRTFNPREDKYMQPDPKFKLAVMKRNIDRVSKLAQAGVEAGKFLQSCFDWESKARSGTAFAVFLIIVWNFELYMLPISLLIIFLKNLLVVHIVGNLMKERDEDEYVDDDEEDEEDEKTEKTSGGFRQKISAIQDACLKVQVVMDDLACLGERIQNTFNWTVPWLSWLAMTLLTIGTVVLFYIPVRYLIMAWGINKFTKKLRSPNAIPNNELLDYLSRVPSDKELSAYRELRPDSNIGTMKKKRA